MVAKPDPAHICMSTTQPFLVSTLQLSLRPFFSLVVPYSTYYPPVLSSVRLPTDEPSVADRHGLSKVLKKWIWTDHQVGKELRRQTQLPVLPYDWLYRGERTMLNCVRVITCLWRNARATSEGEMNCDMYRARLRGLVNCFPAVAYHFCLSLPAAFTQPGQNLLADPCKLMYDYIPSFNAYIGPDSEEHIPSSTAYSRRNRTQSVKSIDAFGFLNSAVSTTIRQVWLATPVGCLILLS